VRRAERQHGARLPRAAQPGAAAAPGELRPGLARSELRGRAGPGAGRPELPRPARATSGARRAAAWRGVAETPATGARGGRRPGAGVRWSGCLGPAGGGASLGEEEERGEEEKRGGGGVEKE